MLAKKPFSSWRISSAGIQHEDLQHNKPWGGLSTFTQSDGQGPQLASPNIGVIAHLFCCFRYQYFQVGQKTIVHKSEKDLQVPAQSVTTTTYVSDKYRRNSKPGLQFGKLLESEDVKLNYKIVTPEKKVPTLSKSTYHISLLTDGKSATSTQGNQTKILEQKTPIYRQLERLPDWRTTEEQLAEILG